MEEDFRDQADQAEHELADMERRRDRLGEEIETVKRDWEARKADDSVPGAEGDADSD